MPLDALRFLSASLLLSGAGLGLLRLLRVRLAPDLALLCAPGVAQAWLACALSLCVTLGVPIGRAAGPIWTGLAILAAWGAIGWWRSAGATTGRAAVGSASVGSQSTESAAAAGDAGASLVSVSAGDGRRAALQLLGVSIAAAAVVILPRLVHGLAERAIGPLDGWSYAATGQYLWAFARDTEGGLSPLHQYAVHLGHVRSVAAASLGFWSVLFTPGDTHASASLLQGLSIFTLATACGAFARAQGLRVAFAAWTIVVSALSGWSLDIIGANNIDNGLALAYPPLLAALVSALPLASVSGWLVGPLLAGAFYTYPEFAILTFGGTALFVVQAFWPQRRDAGTIAIQTSIACLVAGLLLAPAWADLRVFLLNQLAYGTRATGPRPGEGMFIGLLWPRFMPAAFMGLGAETGSDRLLLVMTACAALLMLLVAVGCLVRLARGDFALPAMAAITVAGGLLLILRARYSYGAYKVLAMGWWTFAFALVSAAAFLAERRGRLRPLATLAAGACLLIAPGAALLRVYPEILAPTGEPVRAYRGLAIAVTERTGGAPIALITPSLLREHWATYFLRDTRLVLPVRTGYLGMPHVQNLINRARSVPIDQVRYVATDADRSAGLVPEGWKQVWRGGPFTLWDTRAEGWAAVTRVLHDGRPPALPRPAFALDDQPTTLRVMANRAGRIVIAATLERTPAPTPTPPTPATVLPGPTTVPADEACWSVAVSTAAGVTPRTVRLRPGAFTFSVPVPSGTSSITIAQAPLAPAAAAVNGVARGAPQAGPQGAAQGTPQIVPLHMAALTSAWRSPSLPGIDDRASAFLDYAPCRLP